MVTTDAAQDSRRIRRGSRSRIRSGTRTCPSTKVARTRKKVAADLWMA
jgi:hypothetical protein